MGAEVEIQSLLEAANTGDPAKRQQLFAALYRELHRLAERELRGVKATISPTTLLHEAYLDLSGRQGVSFPDRARFFGYAARAMRGLIIDYVRSRRAQKRGGAFEITSLRTATPLPASDDAELRQIGSALEALSEVEPALAEIVDLKFFCGLTLEEIASLRGVSKRTIQRDWEKARLYLHGALQE
jgi:RNA polymerase sigma factor (TIGR02999 family)